MNPPRGRDRGVSTGGFWAGAARPRGIRPSEIKLVRDHYYSGGSIENIVMSEGELRWAYACDIVEKEAKDLEKDGWVYKGEESDGKEDLTRLDPKEQLSRMRHEAARYLYYGIQRLWLTECKRAQLLLLESNV